MLLNEITTPSNQFTLYRGDSVANLTTFRRVPDGLLGPGIYLTGNPKAAQSYGPHVTKVVATINNPIVVRDASDEAIALAIALDEEFWRAGFNTRGDARRWAMEQWERYAGIGDPEFFDIMRHSGRDGIILYHGNVIVEAAVMSMNQIKIVE